jgi:hypothetical protein
MSNSRVISLAAVAALGIACVSADALAARVAARGGAVAYRGGAVAYRGAVGYRGWGDRADYYRPGMGLAAGAIAGGAIAASRPWYGYGGAGYDYGSSYYGYNPGYGYDQGYTLGGALVPIQLCRGPEGWQLDMQMRRSSRLLEFVV